jgi:hypothetical protein
VEYLLGDAPALTPEIRLLLQFQRLNPREKEHLLLYLEARNHESLE